jgi:hypothetical protein
MLSPPVSSGQKRKDNDKEKNSKNPKDPEVIKIKICY